MSQKIIKKPLIISFVNQKGGVGKTTTAVNLGASLAELKKKILIIDFDPQGNASTAVGMKNNQREVNIYDVIVDKIRIQDSIKKTEIKNLDIISSTLDLAASEFELQKITDWQYILKSKLEELKQDYDYIFIDCPPSLGILTINSLVASNSVLIPLQCEFFALEGVSHLIETIQRIKSYLNRNLYIEGVLLTMYDKRINLSRLIERDVRKHLGDIVYDTIIPRNISLAESTSHGIPVILYNQNSVGSESYLIFAKEFLKKSINNLQINFNKVTENFIEAI